MHMSPLRRIPLAQFLVHSRQLLKDSIEARRPLRLVTGNESADLDSFASSLLYAYLSFPGPCEVQQSTIVPILAIPRADLALRPEFLYLLCELKIPKQDLIFIDDIPTIALTGAGCLNGEKNEMVLVDHNILLENIYPSSRTVVRGVIDHHKDEGKYQDADPRIIKVSGSCASLVTNWGKEKWGEKGSGPGVKEAAKLALAAILIDTTNMRNLKVTDHDRSAVDFLEGQLGGGGVDIYNPGNADASSKEPWNSTKFYEKLSEAKSSLDSLSTNDILRKDYKSFTTTSPSVNQNIPGYITPTLTIGISSVVKSLTYLSSTSRGGPAQFLTNLWKFAQERNLDVAAVMTSFNDEVTGQYSRELLVWEISEEAQRAEYMGHFTCWASSEEGAVDLQPLTGEAGRRGLSSGTGRRLAWKQGNTAMSRKQVAPGMRECLEYGLDSLE